MADPIVLTITRAGRDALVNAQAGTTEAVRIAQIGLSARGFDPAPTLTVLPGEFKRLATIAGRSVSETVIHMTAQDTSADAYDLRGIGLFLEDGTLFGTWAQPDPIFAKFTRTNMLLAFDIAFEAAAAGAIEFGDSSFLYPPATVTERGVARIATQARVDADADGADDAETIVTPRALRARLASLFAEMVDRINASTADINGRFNAFTADINGRFSAFTVVTDQSLATLRGRIDAFTADINGRFATFTAAFDQALATLRNRKVTGTGLASGGGDLSADRTITVSAATAAQIEAGTTADVAVTPAGLGPLRRSAAQAGWATFPGGEPGRRLLLQWGRFTAAADATTAVTFPIAFAGPAFSVVVDGTSSVNVDEQDNYPAVRPATITATGFQVWNAATNNACCFFAIGEIAL